MLRKTFSLWFWVAVVSDLCILAGGMLASLRFLVGPGTYAVQLARLVELGGHVFERPEVLLQVALYLTGFVALAMGISGDIRLLFLWNVSFFVIRMTIPWPQGLPANLRNWVFVTLMLLAMISAYLAVRGTTTSARRFA